MSGLTPASKIQADLQNLFQANLTPGEAYIKFKLTPDITALLSMERVQKSMIVETDKITPMPGMPESVIGVMSSSDRVFCVFDLARLLTVSSQAIARRQYQIIVLQTTTKTPIYFGLAVADLQGIIRFSREKTSSPPQTLLPEIVPYVSKVLQQTHSVPILDFERILAAISSIS